jgi:hypothetical protein
MRVKLGDDATYLVKEVGSISFWMPLGDVLELNDVLFVPSLKKNLISIFRMTNHQCRVIFERHQSTISHCSLASPRTLARGAHVSGLYRVLVDLLTLVHTNGELGEPSNFEKAYAKHVWWDAMEIGSKPVVESVTD